MNLDTLLPTDRTHLLLLIGAAVVGLLLLVVAVILGIRLAKGGFGRRARPTGAQPPLDESELYDLRTPEMKEDVDFWKQMAREIGGPVLELGTRTGRIAIELAKAGLIVTGLEPSRALLQRARVKAETLDPKTRLEWVEAELSNFSLGGRKFRLILASAACLQDLPSLQAIEQCLRAVAAHLEPEGRLVLAVQAPRPETLKMERRHVKTLYSTRTKQVVNYYCAQEVDFTWQRLKTTHEYEIWESNSPRKLQTSVQGSYFTGPEMLLLLRAAGLEAEATYGSYARERPGPSSAQLIFLARLPRFVVPAAPPVQEARASGGQAVAAPATPALPAAQPALVAAGSSAKAGAEATQTPVAPPALPPPTPSSSMGSRDAAPAPAQGLQPSLPPLPRKRTTGRQRPGT